MRVQLGRMIAAAERSLPSRARNRTSLATLENGRVASRSTWSSTFTRRGRRALVPGRCDARRFVRLLLLFSRRDWTCSLGSKPQAPTETIRNAQLSELGVQQMLAKPTTNSIPKPVGILKGEARKRSTGRRRRRGRSLLVAARCGREPDDRRGISEGDRDPDRRRRSRPVRPVRFRRRQGRGRSAGPIDLRRSRPRPVQRRAGAEVDDGRQDRLVRRQHAAAGVGWPDGAGGRTDHVLLRLSDAPDPPLRPLPRGHRFRRGDGEARSSPLRMARWSAPAGPAATAARSGSSTRAAS